MILAEYIHLFNRTYEKKHQVHIYKRYGQIYNRHSLDFIYDKLIFKL
jgi:hypothetical protein